MSFYIRFPAPDKGRIRSSRPARLTAGTNNVHRHVNNRVGHRTLKKFHPLPLLHSRTELQIVNQAGKVVLSVFVARNGSFSVNIGPDYSSHNLGGTIFF